MKVSDIGEFGLIELLARLVEEAQGQAKGTIKPKHRLLLGIGDDAAVWHSSGSCQLATTDTLVQDVHFILDQITWRELGWKALAINLSDIAAMGGWPQCALVTLALPRDIEVSGVIELYEGMLDIAQRYGVTIAGGDIVQAQSVIISITLTGSARRKGTNCRLLRRSAAKVGDMIAVTGYLGSSAAGLKMLKGRCDLDQETVAFLRDAHLRPIPRVFEAQTLLRTGVEAAIDISDGLVADLTRVCQASGVGAQVQVEKVPIHPLLRATFGEEGLPLALAGGEDYELLFTGRGEIIGKVARTIRGKVSIIGEIVAGPEGQVVLFDKEGKQLKLPYEGWDHFHQKTP